MKGKGDKTNYNFVNSFAYSGSINRRRKELGVCSYRVSATSL